MRVLAALVSSSLFALATPGAFADAARAPAERVASAGARPLLAEQRDVVLVVADLVGAEAAISRVARDLGGHVAPGGNVLDVRLPPDRADALLGALDALGQVVARGGSSTDATIEHADLEASLRSARAARERAAATLRLSVNVEESLAVERHLEHLDGEVAGIESALHALSRRTGTVLVRVTLRRATQPEEIPSVELPFPWLNELSPSHLREGGSAPWDDSGSIRSVLDVALQVEGHRLVGRRGGGERSDAIVAAVRMRGTDSDPVGFAAGSDFALGGLDGLVLDLGLMGGLGTRVGRVSAIGLVAGAGYDLWAGGRLRGGLKIPVELFSTLEFDEAARLIVFLQPRWVPTPEARQDGASLLGFADEMALGGAVLLPFLLGEEEIDDGGLRVGFTYSEQMGATRYAASVGIGWGILED